jgi:hypothetical protein
LAAAKWSTVAAHLIALLPDIARRLLLFALQRSRRENFIL